MRIFSRELDEKRMELTEHLGELRSRIMRMLVYLLIGSVFAYYMFPTMYGFLYRPLHAEMVRQNARLVRAGGPSIQSIPFVDGPPNAPVTVAQLNKALTWVKAYASNPITAPPMSIVFLKFHEPFMVRLKVSLIFGLVLVLPFVIYEIAQFVLPALTPNERRPIAMLAPISVLLLVFGISVAYFTMFYAMHWFLSYLADYPQPTVLMQDPNDYILFFVKMMAAFGIAFQLPVVLMGMAFAGVVTSRGLIKHWRWGVVVAAAGGLFTPSNDIFSMALMSIPLLILYGFSIVLVWMVENQRRRRNLAVGALVR